MSRGCPYRCSYCSNAALRAVYPNPRAFVRHRSPSAAVEEVARIVAAIPGIRQIIFNDNILYPSRAWLAEFSPLFGRRVGLPFTANTRPNLVDEETVRLLRRAGCIRVCMGVECGDEDIANRILLRGLDNRTIRRAFRLVREGGMETVSYNILGSPFETRRTMLATVRLNAELRPTRLAGFFYFPFPGTRSFQICAEHGFITRRAGLNVSERVNIVQPSVSEVDVLFVQRAFPRLVRLYMLVNRMPARAARGAEALLDAWLASPFLPRRFLLLLRDLRRFVRSGVRSLVARPPTRDRPATST